MRIAVIGGGSIGRRHATNLKALGETPILYDADPRTVLAAWESGLSSAYIKTLEWLWDTKPEAVIIATPPDSHADLAHQAAWEGVKAIFIEKPLGLKPASEDWLRFLVDPEPLTMVACNWRFHPGPLALKRWLDEGAIGDVQSARISMGYYLPDTKRDYQNSYAATTGVTLDIGSHAVDLALWLLGPARLCSAVVRPAESIGLKGAEGLAELLLEHKSGAVNSVHVSFVDRERQMGITIYGTRGTAEWRQGFEQDNVFLFRDGVVDEIEILTADIDQMYVDELSHFLTCVRENRSTCNPVSSAVDVLKILLEARQCGR